MNKKNLILIVCLSLVMATFFSCEEADSKKEWGNALIYMPQATYGDKKYVVPNSGTSLQHNLNYVISDDKVNIFLGVYRSGLMTMDAYSVKINPGDAMQTGYTRLPDQAFTLPDQVSVTSGSREKTFYLSIDLEFLRNNENTDYSLAVGLSDPSRYTLNTDISTVLVLIKNNLLLEKIDKPE